MVKAQRITGISFVVLGIYVALYSFIQLDVGSIGAPGSGFFTLVCGLGIFVMAGLWLIGSLKSEKSDERLWEKGQWISPLLAVGVTFVYAFLMEPLGYIISTAVFIILWQVIISKGTKITTIVFTLVGTIAMYVLFEVLLSVPLPNGLLRF